MPTVALRYQLPSPPFPARYHRYPDVAIDKTRLARNVYAPLMYDLRKTSLIVLADIGDLRVVSGARWHIHSVEIARTLEAVMTGIKGSTLAKRAVSTGGRLERKDILEYV